MRTWWVCCVCLVIAGAGSLGVLSLTWGQEQPAPGKIPPPVPPVLGKTPPPVPPTPGKTPAPVPPTPGKTPPPVPPKVPDSAKSPDLSKLPYIHQQMMFSARAGKEWLWRYNRADGRFFHGFVPSLRAPLLGDNFLHQAAAAFALARSARFFDEERSAVIARQALLTLLLETQKDPNNPKVRYPTAPGVNPLGAASWLVLAISELPSPGADLLQQSEELCHFIKSHQQADGSLRLPVKKSAGKETDSDTSEPSEYPGLALYALMRSYQHQKEAWKLDVVRKARDYYQELWRKEKNTEMVSWHSAANAEAFLITKEQPFAQCAEEMNDWICTLQYKELNPQRALWNGGFKKWEQGKVKLEAPDVHSAIYLEGLAQGCRVARQRGDLQRFRAYRETCERCGQFLVTLQYTEANSQHFEAKFRGDYLLGGFHPTHQDGILRIDYTQQAVCGLMKCLTEIAELK